MAVLVVGSVALDSVETPFGKADNALGGSGTFFAASASHLTSVQLVGVVGSDYPMDQLRALESRGVDLSGVEQVPGSSFRWAGRYPHDLNSPETLDTQLGVFASFDPKIPERFQNPEFLFLANIDPELQLNVLKQVTNRPKMIACDTMNFWISSKRDQLVELLGHVDLVTLNDGEARQLTGTNNLVTAAKTILSYGPKYVIIKKGEHGALLFSEGKVFFAPAYPLETLFDPTGAGDSFAGGFIGYLAKTGDLSEENLRRAVIYGSAMGSFAVEKFSITRLMEVDKSDIESRVAEFKKLVEFEQEVNV